MFTDALGSLDAKLDLLLGGKRPRPIYKFNPTAGCKPIYQCNPDYNPRRSHRRVPVCKWCPCEGNWAPRDSLVRTLKPKSDTREYNARLILNVTHLGQLKLLCSEIEFLDQFRHAPTGTDDAPTVGKHTVVYAGASPGVHIPLLADMFPHMKFVLIDPNPSAVPSDARIRVIEAFMTDDLSRELAAEYGEDILFISDVRIVSGEEHETAKAQQERIERDMANQKRWYRALKPAAGMFKFRLPWRRNESTQYLNGTIYLPVYGKELTHESRLMVFRNNDNEVAYDNSKYEGQMAFFNQVQRPAIYDGGLCYDCAAFRRIIARHMGRDEVDVEPECIKIFAELDQRAAEWVKKGIPFVNHIQPSTE